MVLELLENGLQKHFDGKSQYLSLFSHLDVSLEEWFRGEILYVLSSLPDITILATNQVVDGVTGRPDFVIQDKTQKLLLELKVLPKDRNYSYGWQRFLAGSNNKKDFEMLRDGERCGIIYVYWPDVDDWKSLKNKLSEKYGVACIHEFEIPIVPGIAIFSLWLRTEYDTESGGIV
jgi:hypothetical protein